MTSPSPPQRRTSAPRKSAPRQGELAPVGPLSLRAGLGHGARGLQRRRRRLGHFSARPGALARLSLERGRPRRHLRREAAAVLCAGAVERPGPDPQGARLRADRPAGQPRRGREGVLLLPRRHPEPQLSALSLQVSAGAYPYRALVEENARRGRTRSAVQPARHRRLRRRTAISTWRSIYAKASPDEIHIRIIAHNRGPETAELHLLPTLWFRNTWSWGDGSAKPSIRADRIAPAGAAWAVQAEHPDSAPTISTAASRPSCCSPRTRATPSGCGASPTRRPTSRTRSIAASSMAGRRGQSGARRAPSSPPGTRSRVAAGAAGAARSRAVRAAARDAVRPQRGGVRDARGGSERVLSTICFPRRARRTTASCARRSPA